MNRPPPPPAGTRTCAGPPEPGRYAEAGLELGSLPALRDLYLAAAGEFFGWLAEYRRWRAAFLTQLQHPC
jgi:hypothetical protein